MSPTVLDLARGLPLACALAAGGCGPVGDARARLEAFLGDDVAPSTGSGSGPGLPAEPPAIAHASADAAAGSSGPDGDPAPADASHATTGQPAGDDAAADSGERPTSLPPAAPSATNVLPGAPGGLPAPAPELPLRDPFVVPPGVTGDPGPPLAPPAPTEPPPTSGGASTIASCLEGEWDAEDLHTWFRRDIVEQAHGRPVRFRGESGSHRLRFEPGVLHGAAEHRRIAFEARLANVDIRYSVDVHGEFEAPFRIESPDVLVVERPARTTLRAREIVRFSAEKSEARRLALPVEGRWQASCSPGALELRPLEAKGPGPALRFVRPGS